MRYRLCVATLIALAAATAAAQDIQLAPEEVRTTFTNKKVFGRAGNGVLIEATLRDDGSATASPGNFTDTGTWRLTETGYCATWKQLRQGKEGCFTVVRRSGTLYVLNLDGSIASQIIRIID